MQGRAGATTAVLLMTLALLCIGLTEAYAQEDESSDAVREEQERYRERVRRELERLRAARRQEEVGEALGGAGLTDEDILIPLRDQIIPGAGRISWGDWALSIFVTQQVLFDDNIYLTEDNQVDDVISSTTAGLRAHRGGRDLELELTGAASQEIFLDNNEESATEGYLSAGFQYGLDGAFLRVADVFRATHRSIQTLGPDPNDPDVEVVQGDRTSQLTNVASVTFGYHWTSFGLEAELSHTIWNYGRVLDPVDATQGRARLLASLESSPKLTWEAALEYRDVAFDMGFNNDYTAAGASAGIAWFPTDKVDVRFRAGYLIQGVKGGGTVLDEDEYAGPSASIGITWRASPKFELGFGYSRDLYSSLGDNYQSVDFAGLKADWQIAPAWRLTFAGTAQRSDRSLGADSTTVSPRLNLAFRATDWLDLGVRAEARARTSDAKNSDYTNQVFGLQAAIIF